MSAARAFSRRLLGVFARRDSDQRIAEELEFHLQMQAEENIRRGMAPDDALRAARISIGGVESVKESWRANRGLPLIESTLKDLRYALRMMRRNPGFTATVVFVLALGIGATTAVFSILYTLMLRPLPYSHSEQLIGLGEVNLKQPSGIMLGPARYANFTDWAAQNRVFSGVAAIRREAVIVNLDGQPERVRGECVSAEFFAILAMQPVRGRTLTKEDFRPGAPRTAVLSHRYWIKAFGGRTDALGRIVRIDGQRTMIVGVMPPRFRASLVEGGSRLWLPLIPDPRGTSDRAAFAYSVLARLRPGIPLERAQNDMDTIGRRLAQQYPEANQDWRVRVERIEDQLGLAARAPIARVLESLVALLLLIACANVANLLLARGAERRKEIALRLAMGAGRLRIARQLLMENLVLAAAGGLAGIVVAWWSVLALAKSSAGIFAEVGVSRFEIDGGVVLFAFGIAGATGITFGIIPAVRGSRSRVNETLKEAGAGYSAAGKKRRAANLLVTCQVALSLVLLITAGLVVTSMSQFWQFDWGFPLDRRLGIGLALSDQRYTDVTKRAAFFRDVLASASALPRVQTAALTSTNPIGQTAPMLRFRLESGAPAEANAAYRVVSPNYLRVLAIPLRNGRFLSETDTAAGEPVAVVNETMARRAWKPGQEPLGRQIEINGKWRTVVGIMADVMNQGMVGRSAYEVAVPLVQDPPHAAMLILHSEGDPLGLARPAISAIHKLDPDQPLDPVRTFEGLHADACGVFGFILSLIGSFAVIAVSLAAAGIYGVTSRSVAIRAREIGIRMALGAGRSRVVSDILREGLWLALAGIVPGALLSLLLLKVLLSKLWWLKAGAPGTIMPVSALLVAIALLACWFPARRATRVDPAATLRAE
ncbi:MAG TPA: ABC transporter permease [Bryobacteraceae bacterium]|nr:ABC transporter permease [Bryobacteraceae bacterium]